MSSITGAVVLGLLALVSEQMNPFMWVGFGATTLLVLLFPKAPVSHPVVVLGGHLVASTIGLVGQWLLPPDWWAVGIIFGASLFGMAALRVVHPPASSIAVALALREGDTLLVLFWPILAGAAFIVLTGLLHHWVITRWERWARS